jgi:hypothetical protein
MKKMILATMALVMVMMVPSVFGVNSVWNSPTGGNILDGTKWTPNGVPGQSDNATILNGYAVTLNGYWNPNSAVMGLNAVGDGSSVLVQISPTGIIECNSMTIAGTASTTVENYGYIDAGLLLTLGNGSPNAELWLPNGKLVADKISHSNVYWDRAKQLIATIRGSSEPGGGAAGIELYELLFQQKVTTRGGNFRIEHGTVYTNEIDYVKVVVGSGAAIYPLDHVLGDLDNDNDVDLADLAIFTRNWLVGVPVQQQASAPPTGGEELSTTSTSKEMVLVTEPVLVEKPVAVAEADPITITDKTVILTEESPVEEISPALTPEQELVETRKAIESLQGFLDDLRLQAAEQEELLMEASQK